MAARAFNRLLLTGLALLTLAGPAPGALASGPASADWALLHAAQEGMTAQVEERLRHGAPIEARDGKGRTPLILAARRNRVDTAALLLARGANAEATDIQGHTAATWAVRMRHLTMLHTILGHLKGTPAFSRQAHLAAAAAADMGDAALEQRIRAHYPESAKTPAPGAAGRPTPTPVPTPTPTLPPAPRAGVPAGSLLMWPRPTRAPKAAEGGRPAADSPAGGVPTPRPPGPPGPTP